MHEEIKNKLLSYDMGTIIVENETKKPFKVVALYFHITVVTPEMQIDYGMGFCVIRTIDTDEPREICFADLMEKYTKLKDLPMKTKFIYQLTGKIV